MKYLINSSGDSIAATIDASYYKGCGLRQGVEREFVAMNYFTKQTHSTYTTESAASSLMHRDYKCFTDIIEEDKMEGQEKKYVLRRLTPMECARLQGFPDWWCDGADGSDSAQYKLWGNGVALPCVAFIMGNIVEDMQKDG